MCHVSHTTNRTEVKTLSGYSQKRLRTKHWTIVEWPSVSTGFIENWWKELKSAVC